MSGNGITVNADNVTLDLMGFALIGPGGSGIGVASGFSTTRRNNAIRNGVIRGWDTGVLTDYFIRSTYEDLRVTNNVYGLYIGMGSSCQPLPVLAGRGVLRAEGVAYDDRSHR